MPPRPYRCLTGCGLFLGLVASVCILVAALVWVAVNFA